MSSTLGFEDLGSSIEWQIINSRENFISAKRKIIMFSLINFLDYNFIFIHVYPIFFAKVLPCDFLAVCARCFRAACKSARTVGC